MNFSYEGQAVRTVMIDGQPWWVLADVCRALKLSNPTVVASTLDDDERTKFELGRQGETNVVSEPGLYGVIMQSRKPEAKAFKRWVKHEVLPQIFNRGGYGKPQVDFHDLETVKGLLVALNDTLEENKKLKDTVFIMEPKAEFYDYALRSDERILPTAIAKEFGLSAAKFNALLCEWGIQYKRGGRYFLYQKYAGMGLTCEHVYDLEDGHTRTALQWTQKGRKFLHDLFKSHGYMPVLLTAQELEA